MANQDLTLALRIKAFVEGLKNVTGLNQEVKSLGATASKPIPDPTPELRNGAEKTSDAVSALGKSLVGLISIAAIKQFVSASVDEFAKAEAAFRGLEAVANHSGVGIGAAMQEAQKLAADGSMTVAESSKALQNLLARGYNVDQAVQTLNHLKDAAAFNRAANLSMGEAVVSASEGLKNENSILVDNAGVTKNVSVLWKEYAASIGKTADELTQSEKVMAEVNGIARETAAQLGNAEKAANSYAGQMNKADAEMKKFGASMGQILAPAVAALANAGVWLIDNFFKPMIFFFKAYSVGMDKASQEMAAFWQRLKTGDVTAYEEEMKRIAQSSEDMLTTFAGNLKSGNLDFKPLGDGAKKAAKDTTEAAAEMGKAMKQAAKDRKESVNEQVKDAEKLRDALIKAFDDSLKAEKSFRDQAKKLRAEAAQKPQDSSAEGQANALFDLVAAEQKLQRMKTSAPLEDVQAQAEQVRQLAGSLDDQARSQEAVNRSKLAEADALDRAAAGESERQAGINEQQKLNEERLALFQTLLKDLEAGKTVTLDADTEKANTALQQVKAVWDEIKDKTVVLTVKTAGTPEAVAAATQSGGGASGSFANVASGAYANGGILPGYGGGDRRLILAEDGEAITRKQAVAYYGRNFMAQLNAMRLPRFANGGIVSDLVSSGVSSGGSGLHPVTLNMPGGGSYAMAAAPDVVAQMKTAIAIEALKHGRR